MNEVTAPSSRGLALTGWLIFMAVVNAWTVYRYYTIIDDFVRHRDPVFTSTLQWALPLLAVLAALNMVAVVLLWTWRMASSTSACAGGGSRWLFFAK